MIDKEIIKQHGFTEEEYHKIREILGRDPNLLELGIFSTQWSEHCSYKSSKKYLKLLPTRGKYVLQGPGENAGVVSLKNGWVLAFKVESHNHPSAIEPFNGAATGVGGIVRDILSMGARPVALMNSLRFGDLQNEKSRHLFDGVVAGISSYGNCIGVPTVAGEVYFEDAYRDNCLVNAACVGLTKIKKLKQGIAKGPGNLLLLVGAKTGRDGIHGATFASDTLEGDKEGKRPSVQIGDPFLEKLLIEATLEAGELDELIGVQDLGAGGLSTTPPEMAKRGGVGIEIDVEKVPVKVKGMTPYEIILSESQERMLFCIKRGSENKFRKIFEKWGLVSSVIGRVIEEKVFRVKKGEKIIAEIPINDLVDGVPMRDLTDKKPEYLEKIKYIEIKNSTNLDIAVKLKRVLSSPNIASKRWVYTQYDHTVRTDTVVRPGEGDAALMRIKGEDFGYAITIDGNSRYVYINPREGAKIAVSEAARNLVSVGAEPMAITDGLNFGNPENPEVYWTFKEVIMGIKEACETLGIPVISGNVSFYNETPQKRIYPTPIIGMIGIVDPLETYITLKFKNPGDYITLVGKQEGKIGGSEYLKVFYNIVGGELDTVDLEFEKHLQNTILILIRKKFLNSVHDVAEGGLLVSVVESLMGSVGLGAFLDLPDLSEKYLFGEWQSRFLITYNDHFRQNVLKILKDNKIPYLEIGNVTNRDSVIISGKTEIEIPLKDLKYTYNHIIERIMQE